MDERLDPRPRFAATSKDHACSLPDSDRQTVGDESYRRILGARAWNNLAPEVRTRFSVKPRVGRSIRYEGVMARVELSFLGWLFAQFCRLIGTPLAPFRGRDVPMLIELSPDQHLPGIVWSRHYEFPGDRAITVRSTKCHTKGGHFVEHIGCGFSMRLKLRERNAGLEFISVGYFFEAYARRIRIPDWLTPGVTTVTHTQLHGDHFRFTLTVKHPLLGVTIHQDGEFYSAVNSR